MRKRLRKSTFPQANSHYYFKSTMN